MSDSSTGRAGAVRAGLLETALLLAMTLLAIGEYALAHAPRFNPPYSTDPWIYTGAMWNFDFLYRFFGDTYYLSRLPWIIPGYLLNDVFSPQTSFLVEHVVFALAAAVSGFLIARRFYGRSAAFAAFGALITSLLFYDAYSTDYPDGAQITFLLVALAFAAYAYEGPRSRLKLGLAGFFTAAAVCTNLFDGLLVVALTLLYALLVWTSLRIDVRARLLDGAVFAGGVAALVVACGTFASAHGGRFLFFMPSWRATGSINTAESKPPDASWVASEPRLLIPLFLLALIAVVWRRTGWKRDAGLRLATGSFAYLALLSLVLGVWEFAGAGAFLYLTPYFKLFNIGIVLCTAAGVGLVARRGGLGTDEAWPAVAAIALVAGAAPVIVIYHGNHFGYVGRPATIIVAALMTITILIALLLRAAPARRRVGLVLVVVALTVFSSSLAGAASSSTVSFSAATLPDGTTPNPNAQGPAAMALARQFLHFMQAHGLQETRPALWLNAASDRSPAAALASLYLYGYSYVTKDMPTVDRTFRRRLEQFSPKAIVMLCARADCADAPQALRLAGYRPHLRARQYLHAGMLHLYLRAYDLPQFQDADGKPGS